MPGPRHVALRRLFLAAALLLTLALPAVAGATGATGASGVSASLLTPTTTTPATTTTPSGPVTVQPTTGSTSSGGLSSTEEIAIFIAAAVLIAGIARIIVADARRHTPAGAPPDPNRPRGTVPPIEHRVKRSRARAKQARRARRSKR